MTLHHGEVARDYTAPQMTEYRYSVYDSYNLAVIDCGAVLASNSAMAAARASARMVAKWRGTSIVVRLDNALEPRTIESDLAEDR